jgi:hypothetical protein
VNNVFEPKQTLTENVFAAIRFQPNSFLEKTFFVARATGGFMWRDSMLEHRRAAALSLRHSSSGQQEKLPSENFCFCLACCGPGHNWRVHVARQHAGAPPCCRTLTPTLLQRTTGKTPKRKFLFLFGVLWTRAQLAGSCGATACWSTAVLPHSHSDTPPADNRKNSQAKIFVFVWRVVDQGTTGGFMWRDSMLEHRRAAALLLRHSSSGQQEKLPSENFCFCLACCGPGHNWRVHVARQHAGAPPCCRTLTPTLLQRTTGKTPKRKFLFLFGVLWTRAQLAGSCGATACWSTAVLPHSHSDTPPADNRKNSQAKIFVFVWRVVDQGTTGGFMWRDSMLEHRRAAALSLRHSSSGQQEKLPSENFCFCLACCGGPAQDRPAQDTEDRPAQDSHVNESGF